MKAIILAIVLIALAWPARAQNNFPTPGGATVPGKVLMCLNGSNQAVPCSGTGNGQNNFPTPGGQTAGGNVRMCINGSGQAVPC